MNEMKKKFFLITLAIIFILNFKNVYATEPIIQTTFSVYPSVVYPGNDGYIQLTLKNTGNTAVNQVKISKVSSEMPIKISTDWISELGGLGINDALTAVFKFSVLNITPPGLYNIKFQIDYCGDAICRTITPNLIINIHSPSTVQLLSISPSSLKPGERTNITFVISNSGNLEINNLIFIWSASNYILPVGYDNRVVVSSLPPNSLYQITREVAVSPSTTPSIYPITVIFQYTDKSGTNQTITSTAGIEISGETDFEVSVQETSSSSATLTIANIGINPAYSVLIRIPKQEGFVVSGAWSNILGNLNPGDYTFTTFQLMGLPNALNKTRNLLVDIAYTDAMGLRRVMQKEVALGEMVFTNKTLPTTRTYFMQRSSLANNATLYIIIGIIGMILVIVALKFFVFKRFKRK
ncbi:MAG: hypothetical protein QW423_02995 [Candidatus Aenigmatarchaeota archaeon]